MAARKKRIAPSRYIIPVGLVCCCLAFVAAGWAKMANDVVISKTGEMQIAGWNVDVSSSDASNMTLDAGENAQTYSLLVTNNSEVASTYSIKVSNIPVGVKVGLDITSDADLVAPTDGEVTLMNTGGDLGFAAPNNTRTHVLTLAADATADTTQSSVDLTIEVLFAQKDPRP